MNQKLLLFGVIALIFVGLGSYILGTKQTQTQIENQMVSQLSPPPTDKISNWKTYANDEYGIEIKYPNNLLVTYSETNGITIQDEKDLNNGRIIIKLVNQNFEEATKNISSYDIKDMLLDGKQAIYYSFGDHNQFNKNYKIKINETQILEISISVTEIGTLSFEKQSKIFDQILFTLKFTDQSQATNETANWKTYNSIPFGIEIKYPPNWGLKEPIMADNAIYLNSNGRSDGPGSQPYVFIGKRENRGGLPFKELVTQELPSEIKNNFNFTKEIINGHTTYKTTSLPAASSTLTVYIAKDPTEKEFIYFGFQPDIPSDKTISTIYDQILSTFKFTN